MSKNLTFRLARNKKERRHQAEQLRKTRQEEGIGGIGGRRFLISCCDFPAGNVSIITFRTIMIEHTISGFEKGYLMMYLINWAEIFCTDITQ